jgi:DNA processing protein
VRGLDAPEAHAAALAGLAGMTPVRLALLTDGFAPVTAWRALQAGTHPGDPRRKFHLAARRTDVGEVAHRYAAAGVSVALPGRPGYPGMLTGDPGAPAVLFALGDPTVLDRRPRVAVVGTRSATPYGRQVASELASDLATAGVTIVSGLARGIDAAAHAGVVRVADGRDVAPPVAVVGTGLDEVYPPSSQDLWEEVAGRGAVLSESPLGTLAHPRVFPARNRIIAALSDVVVVVESHYRGGSLYTAEAAARRSIPVCAVPGSVKSTSSSGTNALLVDGCIPVRDATDVLVALALARAGCDDPVGTRGERGTGRNRSDPSDHSGSADRSVPAGRPGGTRAGGAPGRRPEPTANTDGLSIPERSVLQAMDDTPLAFETILLRTDLSVDAAARACDELVRRGCAVSGPGWWCRS